MTREEAKKLGEKLLAQSMICGKKDDEYEDFLCFAIEALEQPTPEEIIRKCAEVMVNRMIWGSGVEWEINRLEKYLREKVLNNV